MRKRKCIACHVHQRILNQREASPSASRRGGSALCQPTSALLHIGVGEGDDVSVQALQLHRARGEARLLAAGARMLHGGGEVRVPGNRQRTRLAMISDSTQTLSTFPRSSGFWVWGFFFSLVEEIERILTWCKYCRTPHNTASPPRHSTGSSCV